MINLKKIKNLENYTRKLWKEYGVLGVQISKEFYISFSEQFIREFTEYLDWRMVSLYSKLSKEFMREFKDKLWWDRVVVKQKMTNKFNKEIRDEIVK